MFIQPDLINMTDFFITGHPGYADMLKNLSLIWSRKYILSLRCIFAASDKLSAQFHKHIHLFRVHLPVDPDGPGPGAEPDRLHSVPVHQGPPPLHSGEQTCSNQM